MKHIALFLSFCILATGAIAAKPPLAPLPETTRSTIGYPTVAAALDAVRRKPGVRVEVRKGWTLVFDKGGLTVWSFTPPDYPAYPAVVKRVMSEKNGAWFVKMNILCEASKTACDKLVRDFDALNEKLRQSIQHAHKAQQGAPADRPPAAQSGGG